MSSPAARHFSAGDEAHAEAQEMDISDATHMINAFTVDVEDYYHVDAFSACIPRERWSTYASRVVDNTRRILRLLGDAGALGTFYVLGDVARQHPQLVREIQRDGHEIGCHSYGHQPIYRLTPDEFRDDLELATGVLTDIVGSRVSTFRAPNFSIRGDTLWALDILADAGYLVDSSIFPVVHDQYGLPGAEPAPHRRELAHGSIWEFPPSVYRSLLGNIPVAGGGYFRLFPFAASQWFLRRILTGAGRPLMFYIHPWEIDVDQPRIRTSWKSRFRHYQHLHTTEPKLRRLLQTFRFGTVTQSLESAGIGFEVSVDPGESPPPLAGLPLHLTDDERCAIEVPPR